MTSRQDIINATINLFEKCGMKFSILDIAEALNTSKRTIYKYFESKDELVYETIVTVFDDIERQHYEILATDLPLIEKLREILLVYPTIINLDSIRLNSLLQQYPDINNIIDNQLASKWELTLSVFNDCKNKGLVANCSDAAFRTIMLGVYNGTMLYENHKTLLKECIDTVFEGLMLKS